jgi:uncharacterized membrane protein
MRPIDTEEKRIHFLFLLAIVLKGLNGLLEIGLGLLLMFTDTFSNVVFFLTRDAIIDDPDNYFATHLRAFASQSHEAFFIGGLYLVAHGSVKVFIAGTLWRNYSWAYPAAMAILALFILYEAIYVIQTYSIPFFLLSLFDVVMLWLVSHEYKKWPHHV